jgi:hypothetical protein
MTYDEIYKWCRSEEVSVTSDQADTIAMKFYTPQASSKGGEAVADEDIPSAFYDWCPYDGKERSDLEIFSAGYRAALVAPGAAIAAREQESIDAARYRWMRAAAKHGDDGRDCSVRHWLWTAPFGTGTNFDGSIDGAMIRMQCKRQAESREEAPAAPRQSESASNPSCPQPELCGAKTCEFCQDTAAQPADGKGEK